MSNLEPEHALNLDKDQQQSFIRFFKNLPEKPSSTVRIFNRTDYYSLHGDDATFASEFTSATVRYMGEEPKLPYVSINLSQFETFVRELLLVRQYRVEVYVLPSQSKNNDWRLEFKGSPGNLTQFEDIIFENAAVTCTSNVMGIKIVKDRVFAVAVVNITEVKFEICEIRDNECNSELEGLIAQISPKECVIPVGNSDELNALKTVLERNGIPIARVNRSEFTADNIIQDLNRLLLFHEGQQRNAESLKEAQQTEPMCCLQAIINFLNLTGDERNFNQFKLSSFDMQRFVRLDNAALYALNALPKVGTSEDSKSSSLLGILNYCITSQGRRLLEQWIRQPLKDYHLIKDRLDIVELLVKNAETRTLLAENALVCFPDLIFLSKKLSGKRCTLQDCYRIYQTVGNIPHLISVLKKLQNKCVDGMLVGPISEIMEDLEKYQSMIEQILDMRLVDRGEFLVKSNFDEELNDFGKKRDKIEEKMQKLLRLASDDLPCEVKLESTDQLGYFFRITLKEEAALRKNKGYKVIDALQRGVRFTNNRLETLNHEYSDLRDAYEQQQKAVLNEVFEVAAGYADSLRSLNTLIAIADVLVSFATAAVLAKIPYVRPNIHKPDVRVLNLTKIRHPCLEQQDDVAYIPNDVSFVKDRKTLHIITGPNMCGKSTYIRSVAVSVLMAHIGSMVPCETAEISLVDGILARVGADDCQLKGLSTFMLEMVETASIIKSATCNSLVIIDELGRGTSTYDGCGIAWAIAEHLASKIKCFTLFATHYHEITRIAEQFPCVDNLHVTAVTTNNTITPLYQIREGECDKSYGIQCARMVGFPEDVITWAINHQKELEHFEGTKLIGDYEPEIKRKIVEEGDKMVKATLEKLKSANVDQMTDDQLGAFLKEIKTELESSENLFIKGLVSS